MTLWRTILIASCLSPCLAAGQQLGTPTQEQLQTIFDIRKLETAITLDRKQYFPGEVCTFTITVRNPGPVPLRVQPPFDSFMGIDLMEKGTPAAKEFGTDYWYVSPHPHSAPSNPFHPPIVIAPGEILTKTLSSLSALEEDSGGIRFNNWTVPSRPGSYRAVFSYDPRKHFDFEVVPAILVSYRSIRLASERLPGRGGGPEIVSPRRVFAYLIQSGDEQFLCASADFDRGVRSPPAPGRPVDGDMRGYTRLFKLSGPISDFGLTVDARERVQLTWSAVVEGTARQERQFVRLFSSRIE